MKPELYLTIANIVDFIHALVLIFWVGGLFVPAKRHPRFRLYHSYFGICVIMCQIILGFRCPLALVSSYLRELAKPGNPNNWHYKPFTIELLRNTFGFAPPPYVIVLVFLTGTVVMVAVLLELRKEYQREEEEERP